MNTSDVDALLRGSPWFARPDSYSHLVSLKFLPEQRVEVTLGYGQTLYLVGACQYALPDPATLRLTYDCTPKRLARGFALTFGEELTLPFKLEQGDFSGNMDTVRFNFAYGWRLEFSQPPFPKGIPFPVDLPAVFFGYGQPIVAVSAPTGNA